MTKTKNKHWTLYILRLEEQKYYVGITSQTPERRLYEHQHDIRAANWTRKYKPVKIIYTDSLGSIAKATAEKRENKMVRACIKNTASTPYAAAILSQ